MKNDLINYLKDLSDETQQRILLLFDILGIGLFLFPNIAEWLIKDVFLTRSIGLFIFILSFFIANFKIYRKLSFRIPQSDEDALQIYFHKNPPYNAAKLLYTGKEIARDLIVKIHYIDANGDEQTKTITEFFPETDPKMWQHHYKRDFLREGQVEYIHLIQKKNSSNGQVQVTATFTGASSKKQITVEKEFELIDF